VSSPVVSGMSNDQQPADSRPHDCGGSCGENDACTSCGGDVTAREHAKAQWAVMKAHARSTGSAFWSTALARAEFFQPDSDGWRPSALSPLAQHFNGTHGVVSEFGPYAVASIQARAASSARGADPSAHDPEGDGSGWAGGSILVGDPLDAHAGGASEADEPATELPKLCCCPASLLITPMRSDYKWKLPPTPKWMTEKEAKNRKLMTMSLGWHDLIGHAFNIDFNAEMLPYREFEPCAVSWKESAVSSDGMDPRNAFVPGGIPQGTAVDSMSVFGERAAAAPTFEHWVRRMGTVNTPPSRPPSIVGMWPIPLPDAPGVATSGARGEYWRNLEIEVTVLPGCAHCQPLTVKIAQSVRLSGKRVIRNYLTHSQDMLQSGPGTPADASSDGFEFSPEDYGRWARSIHRKWGTPQGGG